MSSICLAITRSPRLDATEQSCRDRARRMSVEASCGFDRGDSCRPPIVLVSARPRSNIRAVWHLDEFVVANVRAGPRVHVFPADFTVRQTVILGHGLVVPDFIYCPAVRAFKSFRHLKKYTLVRCWLPDGLLMVCNRRYPSAPALGRRAQARRGALPGQGLTHLFSSGRGVCNARGLRVSGGGADQIRDPATGQPGSLQSRIGYLLTRPVGRPPHHVRRFHANFSYQAGTWSKPRRVIAKVEWHPGELYPRVGFIVTNMSRPAERVVAFYNKRGTCEQWIKEGKGAIKWTRLSCRTFAANAVRLQLHALAYNLGNFLRTLPTPEPIKDWTLTSLKDKLIKIGAKVVSHGRYVACQMGEVAIPPALFQEILRLIPQLGPQPPPALA